VPKSVIRTHDKEFLAAVPVSAYGQAIGMPDSGAGLTQSRPVAPAAVRRCLPDLPDVAVASSGEDFLPAILISPNDELGG
jgi:hypothetical protein